jgi:CheY-like chemotaxis protein
MTTATILIVDDDAIIATHLESLLTGHGYTVPPLLSSGEEAVAAVAAQPPDLILTDTQLAGEMDGITAAANIHPRFDIPVVYLTAPVIHSPGSTGRLT